MSFHNRLMEKSNIIAPKLSITTNEPASEIHHFPGTYLLPCS
jgi:hypothetical protein